MKSVYDVIVIGSGPNGLAAAIQLQVLGLHVLLVEAQPTVGGGMRTKELTLPGFSHDVCSAFYPMGISSPFLSQLPLERFGLEWIYPEVAAAHPFEDGSALGLFSSLEQTALALGKDQSTYLDVISPLVEHWDQLIGDILSPPGIPAHPGKFVKFGLNAILPAKLFGNYIFKENRTRGFWAGMAAHSVQPLSNFGTSAIALTLLAAGHAKGWPIPKSGAQALADAMLGYFLSMGGEVQTSWLIKDVRELPQHKVLVFDTSVPALAKIAGAKLPNSYLKKLKKFRYGMGVFKVDWALSGPIPFKSPIARKAGTIHLGSGMEEICHSELQAANGRISQTPFVLLGQQSLFDSTRAPKEMHTAWGYCHVPNGSNVDRTELIENQIERFAPGFKELILARHSINSAQMEAYNPNYVGGDVNGGSMDIAQLFMRPTFQLKPYRTPAKGIYLCSSSTPPGGGVHGMCGYNAAKQIVKDFFPDLEAC